MDWKDILITITIPVGLLLMLIVNIISSHGREVGIPRMRNPPPPPPIE